MTYGEESDDPDFEDDEEFASDFNESDPGTSGETIAVDDSTLQPAKGDAP
jgi:hypothetical protein